MPGHKNQHGHGYLVRTVPAGQNPVAAAQQIAALAVQGLTIDVVSVMEAGGQTPGAPATAGRTIIIAAGTQDPHRSAPAHQKLQALATVVDGLGYSAPTGLANHFCCFSDH